MGSSVTASAEGSVAKDLIRKLKATWRQYRKGASPDFSPVSISIGITASFTVDPLVPLLGGMLIEQGSGSPRIELADYNQIVPTCFDPASHLNGLTPDVLLVLWRLEDIADSENVGAVNESSATILSAISTLRKHFDGMIVFAVPPRPRPVTEGIAEFSRQSRLWSAWHRIACEVDEFAQKSANCYTIDCEAMIARLGEGAALDGRNDLLYRLPFAEAWYLEAARAVARLVDARRGGAKKCLVLDCDNTIWGGIIGEDGVGGIALSDDMPGRAFREFQKQIRTLRQSGILLALNSKNNPDDVSEIFDNHTAMILKSEDISAKRINWRPKSENLKEIARDLNIGLDALVFLDDSPFEIEDVRHSAPEVTVIQVPDDPAELPRIMADQVAHLFHRLDVTDDDRRRADMMRVEAQRTDLRQTMTEESFLASLSLKVSFFEPAESDFARVTQLVNKTNQFNVTTRRYTEAEIRRFTTDAGSLVLCASVRDKFGDYGLVGVAIVHHNQHRGEIDSLLMSCRVLGRGIESAMMAVLRDWARRRGAAELVGRYIPTAKNQMVKDLFERHGFNRMPTDSASGLEDIWATEPTAVAIPKFLNVERSGTIDESA